MNPAYCAIITATVALLTLVFAIFGAAWLNGRNIERMIDSLKAEMRAENESLRNEFRSEMKRLDQRMDSLEQRLGRVERQLEAIFKPSLPR